jgi:2-dehydro-3-deoxyphosphogluconate aldolase / (4S)-4-hydroxy-2-oxoglutarate aldolase
MPLPFSSFPNGCAMPAPQIADVVAVASVIPVLTVNDVAKAAPLAHALKAGGLRVIEMTMRTTNALEVLKAMKAAEPSLYVGMGTLLTPDQVVNACDAGADFLVTPGLTERLAACLRVAGVGALPGVATLSEAMQAAEWGFARCKFFPAEQSGGAPWLKSVSGPLPEMRFCPTGSISEDKAPGYLCLPNVDCVGGSWIVPPEAMMSNNWDLITENAARAQRMKLDLQA